MAWHGVTSRGSVLQISVMAWVARQNCNRDQRTGSRDRNAPMPRGVIRHQRAGHGRDQVRRLACLREGVGSHERQRAAGLDDDARGRRSARPVAGASRLVLNSTVRISEPARHQREGCDAAGGVEPRGDDSGMDRSRSAGSTGVRIRHRQIDLAGLEPENRNAERPHRRVVVSKVRSRSPDIGFFGSKRGMTHFIRVWLARPGFQP